MASPDVEAFLTRLAIERKGLGLDSESGDERQFSPPLYSRATPGGR